MTITLTHPQSQSHRTRRMIFAALLTAAAAILVFAVVRTMTDGATQPPERSVVEANGVSGLSPASAIAHPVHSFTSFPDTRGVADWAEANGVSGLSPASATQQVHSFTSFPDTRGVTDWAEANGVSGLSPASATQQG